MNDISSARVTASVSINQSNSSRVIFSESLVTKSLFEKYIINAYKSLNVNEAHNLLIRANNELLTYIDEVKNKENEMIINKNIIERLKRIIHRQYFNLTMEIAKIYNSILDKTNFNYLSNDFNLLITIANEVLLLLDLILYTSTHRDLQRKCEDYLKFLINEPKKQLTNKQTKAIQLLLDGMPKKYFSKQYLSFGNLLKEFSIKEMNMLMIDDYVKAFGKLSSLQEQYDSFLGVDSKYFLNRILNGKNMTYVSSSFSSSSYVPNYDYMLSIGRIMLKMLFCDKYLIKASLNEEEVNDNNDIQYSYYNEIYNDNKEAQKTYLLIDAQQQSNSKIQSGSYANINFTFINNSIYSIQNEVLNFLKDNQKALIHIYKLFLFQVINHYSNNLCIIHITIILLKRIYHFFPIVLNDITSLIIDITNIITTLHNDNKHHINFLYDLSMTCPNDSIKEFIAEKLKSIQSAQPHINSLNKTDNEIVLNQAETVNIKHWNLNIGYSITYKIKAREMHTQYLEITHNNSLIYIFFEVNTKDISCYLMKYAPKNNKKDDDTSGIMTINQEFDNHSDKEHFIEVFRNEYIKCSKQPIKLIVFVQSTGIYKLIFDNSYSWITSKKVKCKIHILEPLTNIDYLNEIQQNNSVINKKTKVYLFHNNLNYTFDISIIHQRIINYNDKKSSQEIIVSIIVYQYSLKIIEFSNDSNSQSQLFIDNKPSSKDQISQEFLEKTIKSYLHNHIQYHSTPSLPIIINIFSMNQGNIITDNPIQNSISKIGCYPHNLLQQNPLLKYNCYTLTHEALIWSLMELTKHKTEYESICYFHIDSLNTQVSIYNEGIICEKIIGFEYDNNASLMNNIELFTTFIIEANDLFEKLQIEFSYSDITEDEFNDFLVKLKVKINEKILKIPIPFFQHDKDHIINILRYSHLFYNDY